MSIRLNKQHSSWKKSRIGLTVELAATKEEIEESQQLRHIFSEAMGIDGGEASNILDKEHYDSHCHHLVVRDYYKGTVVGCTRILIKNRQRHTRRFYSENQFNIGEILKLRGKTMEVGQTCIHPDYLNGGAMLILWAGLSRLIDMHQIDYMIGCSSISLLHGHRSAQAAIQYLRENHPAPKHLNITPHHPFQLDETVLADKSALSSILETYLQLGACVWGDGSLNAKLNAVNLFFLLETTNLNPSYRSTCMERRLGSAIKNGSTGPLYL